MLLIKNGKIKPMSGADIDSGYVLIDDNGKIAEVGSGEIEVAGATVIDAAGRLVTPGCVEAHCHIGVDNSAMRWEGADYNEMGDIVACHLRAIDAIEPRDETLVEAREAGVTTLCAGPGSANVLGGTFAAYKPVGKRIDDMVIKAEVAMKCAFGENPKRCYRDKGNSARMTTAAKLREMLFKAREYRQKIDRAGGDPEKMPAFDMKLHALLPRALPCACRCLRCSVPSQPPEAYS